MNKKNQLKNSDKYIGKIIRLPLHNYLSVKNVDYVSKVVKNYFVK